MKYNAVEIEAKWQKRWEENSIFQIDLADTTRKLYCLVMFIYPSSDRLHIGHWFNYGPTDTWARLKMLQGHRVFEPMGYDAFGLPAENAAVRTGVHPSESTRANIEDIRRQLKRIGAMYDWRYEIDTSTPEYYKWTQWLFLQLYKMKKAYRANAPVNWCPNDKTVLANEQVIDGACERCGTQVIKRDLTQWFFKITDYADELLEMLDTLDWPEKTKLMQRNWIGKSKGIEIIFKVGDTDTSFGVFTTRPDTLFGVTYAVLAPEHRLVKEITTDEYRTSVEAYIEQTRRETEIDRQSLDREKTGVPTGAFAINPINNEKIPIWIADYVLYSYGTGAVMAVPGHDERDFEFAKKFGLPIIKVILQPGKQEDDPLEEAYTGTGIMISSGEYNGLDSEIGIERISDALEKIKIGKRKINYRLRDWLVSRQRYWGAPIPIVHCPQCGEVPVPEDQLPVLLPKDVDFLPGGESPLARCQEYINTVCPNCGRPAQRDADTMDTFVCSSWYYLRFPNPNLDDRPFDTELIKKWLPVDKYVGGAEHAVMHLLYARFITKALRDAGYLEFDEPFQSLVHQGTITHAGAKMSKTRGNVINPDQFVDSYGSDVFRMYLMFMGPYEEGGDWSDTGIVGIDRFVRRFYQIVEDQKNTLETFRYSTETMSLDRFEGNARSLYRKMNLTIKKVSEDTEKFQFNTAIAAMMELLNELIKFVQQNKNRTESENRLLARCIQNTILLISPFAPHLAEELWEMAGNPTGIFEGSRWPSYNTDALEADEITIVAQINGKIRSRIILPAGLPEDTLKRIVFEDEHMKRHLDGKRIVKVIVVPNKLVNVVVK
jgi:leucyl-tRNA synthetase